MKRRHLLRTASAIALAHNTSVWAQRANPLAAHINVKPNDPRLQYSGFANLRLTSQEAVGDRMIPDSPFRLDNPGARIRFETNASEVSLVFSFARVDSIPGRTHWTGEAMLSVNGTDRLRMGRVKGSSGPQVTKLSLGGIDARVLEITFPMADVMTFQGIILPKGAELFAMKREVLPRFVAYGDSITQGFHAANVVESYPTRLARGKNWDLVNMGFGSRRLTIPDGAVLARLKPSIATVLIGVNDCLQQKPVDRFAADVAGFVTEFRRAAPRTPIAWITPLPVADPSKWKYSERLDSYRTAVASTLSRIADPAIHLIQGTDLIDPDPKLFADGLHLNSDGFAAIATRLEPLLPALA